MQTDLEGMTVFTRSKNLPEILMITRKIIVKEAGKEERVRKKKKQKKEIKWEEDAEPDGANIDTSALKEEEGVLFSVVPLLWNRQGKASLVQGRDCIP